MTIARASSWFITSPRPQNSSGARFLIDGCSKQDHFLLLQSEEAGSPGVKPGRHREVVSTVPGTRSLPDVLATLSHFILIGSDPRDINGETEAGFQPRGGYRRLGWRLAVFLIGTALYLTPAAALAVEGEG